MQLSQSNTQSPESRSNRHSRTTTMASLLSPPLKFATRSVFFIAILWIGLVCTAEINASGDIGAVLGKGGSKQREFDYFKLALQWPATYCRKTRHCCASNGCCRGYFLYSCYFHDISATVVLFY